MSKRHQHKQHANNGQRDAKGHLSGHSLNRKARRLQHEQQRNRLAQMAKRGVYVHVLHHS
jgi:hypothetical protein